MAIPDVEGPVVTVLVVEGIRPLNTPLMTISPPGSSENPHKSTVATSGTAHAAPIVNNSAANEADLGLTVHIPLILTKWLSATPIKLTPPASLTAPTHGTAGLIGSAVV